MASHGTSLDLGEDLGIGKKQDPPKEKPASFPSRVETPVDVGPPNVALVWEQSPNVPGGREPQPRIAEVPISSISKMVFVALVIASVAIIMLAGWWSFTKTMDFPGVDKAVEAKILNDLRLEASHQISQDYRTVSEIRKRAMFQERFSSLSSSPETKALIQSKQQATKDLFKNDNGQPYLYTPEAYRYATLASGDLGLSPPLEDAAVSSQDREMGRAIARFYRTAAEAGASQGVEWAAAMLPVAIGLAVLALAGIAALVLGMHPIGLLATGLIAGLHPMVASGFSAGLTQAAILYLVPVMAVLLAGAGVIGLKPWWAKGAAGVALAFLVATWLSWEIACLLFFAGGLVMLSSARTSKSWLTGVAGVVLAAGALVLLWENRLLDVQAFLPAINHEGRIVTVLAAIGVLAAAWKVLKARHDAGLVAASAVWLMALAVPRLDGSGILPVLGASILIGVLLCRALPVLQRSLEAFGVPRRMHASLAVSMILLALVALAASARVSSSKALLLPGVDDAVAGAGEALRKQAFPGDVFISDAQSSDALMFFGRTAPAVMNSSPPGRKEALARALASSQEDEASALLLLLACSKPSQEVTVPDNASAQEIRQEVSPMKASCPRNAFVVVTDRTWEGLNDYARTAKKETFGQQASGISSCDIKPQGGIMCANGFEVLGLNATRKGLFPEQMVSLIGKKRVVPYNESRIEGSFVIYREGERLFSMTVPTPLADSTLVLAMTHDNMTFLKEVYASSNPTHAVVYAVER